MDIGKKYERLYEHWLQEFQQTEITHLDQDTFSYYKKTVNLINNYKEETKDIIQNQLIDAYKNNITFLFNDLLKIRETEIKLDLLRKRYRYLFVDGIEEPMNKEI